MSYSSVGIVYLMFFLSGAAALVYQVVWVRALTLVFGGSHLAVTAVLSTFMAGLAIGGYTIGKYADAVRKPLRLYGLLELAVAVFAIIFLLLMKIYPSVYVPLARVYDDSPLYLSFVRILFSVVALIVPTCLMGGTLPLLTRFVAGDPRNLRNHLSFLYGFNTLGAAVGAIAAGFFLLRFYSVSVTVFAAVVTNIAIGLASILLQDRPAIVSAMAPAREKRAAPEERTDPGASSPEVIGAAFRLKLVMWGIGVSGFCALGYEVLWTRILALVLGASVYSFTTMLVAFLTGIGLGSAAYALSGKVFKPGDKPASRSITAFGFVQITIGITSLLVTIYLRDLPAHITGLHAYFQAMGVGLFGVRVWSDFFLAFAYMVVPAFFMGVAFPLAGKIHGQYRNVVGEAVGEVLAYNTVGAIFGAAASGLVLMYWFGIERSLQMLIAINIGFGLFVLAGARRQRIVRWLPPALTVAVLLFLALNHDALRIWDSNYFAIFRSNQMEAFSSPERRRDAMENTEVLYYAEGAESIVSSVKVKGAEQAFITNGRVEASSHLQGQQNMFALSHLPMLLNKNPKKALVVGLGSGMTLGAISVHPGLERLVLAELESKVLGVARTFEAYNHKVLDNPKLKIVFNDGRNYLLTTPEKFDVITADPIHPWFRGAGYLYTSEYFALASRHLNQGGICQWLPIYELTPGDLRSIVRSFSLHFSHTMLFLTHYDAELIGSNDPIRIDESSLDRRMAEPAISGDLKRVMMGSAEDLLSYFLMGTSGMKEFSKGAVVNTDDNLYLEFSAPFSIGNQRVMGEDILALFEHRESILPYLTPPADERARAEQKRKWMTNQEAQKVLVPALAMLLSGQSQTDGFKRLADELDRKYASYAPARFLKEEYKSAAATNPSLLKKVVLQLKDKGGQPVTREISAVLVPVSKERSAVVIVDNDARIIFGQIYVSGSGKEELIKRFVNDSVSEILAVYKKEVEIARKGKETFPEADSTLQKIKETIITRIKESEKS